MGNAASFFSNKGFSTKANTQDESLIMRLIEYKYIKIEVENNIKNLQLAQTNFASIETNRSLTEKEMANKFLVEQYLVEVTDKLQVLEGIIQDIELKLPPKARVQL